MASTLPQAATECCPPACDSVTSVQVPGPQGIAGNNGTNGTNGVSPFTTFTVDYPIPAELASSVATVGDTSWMVISQKLYGSRVDGSIHAFFEVLAIGGATSVTLKNLEDAATASYLENSAPASVLNIGSKLYPAGIQGPNGNLTGAASGHLKGTYPGPSIALNNAKGALIVGNGTDSVAVTAGSDGFMLAYDSTDAEGIKNLKAIPVTGDTDVSAQRLVRLSATTGLPIPLESTKALLNNPGGAGVLVLDASSGNARGTNAVDLQVVRGAAANVASGTRNVICGGQSNQTSADDSAIVGGASNVTTAARSFIGAGSSNSTGGADSVVGGGSGNTAVGVSSVIAGGELNDASSNTAIGGGTSNDANGQYSSIPGGLQAKADLYGSFTHSAGVFSAAGDAQINEILMRVSTSDATPTELVLGASAGCPIASGKNFFFDIKLIARRTDTQADAIYTSIGVIRNIAGTTTASGITTTEVFDGATLPASPVTVAADDANDTLDITVTGIAATTIRWVAVVRLLEVG